jgi:hypothetical protein
MFGKKKQPPQQKEVARYFTVDADRQQEIRKQAWEDWDKICQEFPDVTDSDAGLNCSLSWGVIFTGTIQTCLFQSIGLPWNDNWHV